MDPRIMELLQRILGGGGITPGAPGFGDPTGGNPEALIQQLMQQSGSAPMPNPMGEDPGAMIDAGMGMVPDNQMAAPMDRAMMQRHPIQRMPSTARQPKPIRNPITLPSGETVPSSGRSSTAMPSTRNQPKPQKGPDTSLPKTSKQPKPKHPKTSETQEGEGGVPKKKKKSAKQNLADQYQ